MSYVDGTVACMASDAEEMTWSPDDLRDAKRDWWRRVAGQLLVLFVWSGASVGVLTQVGRTGRDAVVGTTLSPGQAQPVVTAAIAMVATLTIALSARRDFQAADVGQAVDEVQWLVLAGQAALCIAGLSVGLVIASADHGTKEHGTWTATLCISLVGCWLALLADWGAVGRKNRLEAPRRLAAAQHGEKVLAPKTFRALHHIAFDDVPKKVTALRLASVGLGVPVVLYFAWALVALIDGARIEQASAFMAAALAGTATTFCALVFWRYVGAIFYADREHARSWLRWPTWWVATLLGAVFTWGTAMSVVLMVGVGPNPPHAWILGLGVAWPIFLSFSCGVACIAAKRRSERTLRWYRWILADRSRRASAVRVVGVSVLLFGRYGRMIERRQRARLQRILRSEHGLVPSRSEP